MDNKKHQTQVFNNLSNKNIFYKDRQMDVDNEEIISH